MKTLIGTILLLISLPAFSCPAFREPAVNFSGITTEVELSQYKLKIAREISEQHREVSRCRNEEYRRESDRGRGYEQIARNMREGDQWLADSKAFKAQLDTAGKAHLALIAAQPFQGAYSGHGMASTGGATRSPSTTYNASAPAARTNAAASDSSAGQSRSSANGGRPTYEPFANCVRITPPGPNQFQRIPNVCDQPLEVYWQGPTGSWNMTTIAGGNYYPGGEKPMRTLACHKGDIYNKQTGLCTGW